MDNTLLISLSQQVAAYRAMDVIANNLANVSTPAYKREAMQFREYVDQLPAAAGQSGPQSISFVQDAGTVSDLTEGKLDHTGAPYDLAINGKGYFQIQTANGTRYTRDGHFLLNSDGELVTASGDPVLGDGGPVTVTPNDGDIHIADDGTVSGKQGQISKISLVDFPNDQALVKDGTNLYSTTQAPTQVTNSQILQGTIEASNVQPVVEISRMLEIMRAYQATTSLTKSQSDLKLQAIDKLGSAQ
ncbi:MAG: flagellar basal-body rod protein FlgF [Alphaproteobacteria bacterium]|nr:flagellar basal-body rod protein FlgF [Alphaproteobacteria bacterium]MDE2013314.1 flagellar basal-body rod protein FlgF [Alphaproteobacteria bacterium]MDE2072250.1 flagellar basal-body rod protein FlgF [Alphaproteobacteria bacterium]MDE2350657.1 flagellar basal-body rod protein FlgF [Alphaproteobacteria bacterium]